MPTAAEKKKKESMATTRMPKDVMMQRIITDWSDFTPAQKRSVHTGTLSTRLLSKSLKLNKRQ